MVMRISGFSSGLDIDSLVKDLMKAKRAPLDKLTQQKTTLEWQREQYRDLNIKMIDLRNNKLFNYNLTGSLSAKQVSISGNSTAFSAKATSSAEVGSMSVKVEQVGSYSTLASTQNIELDSGKQFPLDKNAALKDLGLTGLTFDGDGNTTFTIGKLKEIGGVDSLDPDAATRTTITINKDDSLNDLIAKINKDSNVTAYIDAATGKFSLTSKEMDGKKIGVEGDLMNVLLPSTNQDNKQGNVAQVYINGILLEKTSNTFVQDGVEITLNAKSESVSNLTIKANTDSIVDSVKAFIKDYNDLLESVNNRLNEERYRSYTPLTTAQKAEMKDDEIKLWDEKARSGLLGRQSAACYVIRC